ncbi:hypothetical protein BT93_J1979 [Corymbia citriodora subsp. variegata]|nr:hypothetical protein BT93_J1979 [Corymbia citriodora subsp. variegata]
MRFTLEIPQKDTNLSNVAWLAPDPVSNGTALYISKKIRFLDKPRLPLSAGAAFAGLTKLLEDNAPKAMKEQKLESYFGHSIAVDASMSIYHFLVVVGRKGSHHHLQGMFYRTIRLLEAGIKPASKSLQNGTLLLCSLLFSFLELPMNTFISEQGSMEKFSKRTVENNEDCNKLLRLMGVPVVEILEEMNLHMDQFIGLWSLSECDYCESIQGGLTALKLIHQHGTIENILENINKQRYQIRDKWPYSEAGMLFEEPIVSTEEQPEIKWTAPNEEGLISFLVNENGFNIDRVIEKIKASKDESSQGYECTLQSPNLAFKPKTFSTQVSVNLQPQFLGSVKMPPTVLDLRNFRQLLRVVCLLTWCLMMVNARTPFIERVLTCRCCFCQLS